jgi:hydrogenase expression/formation protein HypC
MCITAPALVVGLDGPEATVDLGGVRRRASTLVVPGVAVGDWVIVGAGTILRRLDPREGLELARIITLAAAADDDRAAPAGGEP